MKSYIRNAEIISVVLVCALFLAGGSCEEEKVPSCDEAMDSFYDAECSLSYYEETLSEGDAEDSCEDLKDDAEDEDCMKEFKALVKCFNSAEDEDDCDNCNGELEDVVDCIDYDGASDGDVDGDSDGDVDGDSDSDSDSDGDTCYSGSHSEPSCSDCESWEYCEPGSSSSGIYCLQPCETSAQCCAPLTCMSNEWYGSAQITICSDNGL